MKRCPSCAEEIQDAAILCRHCGRSMVPSHIATLAARWGSMREKERAKAWEQLAADEGAMLTAALQTPQAYQPVAAAAVVRERQQRSPWGCAILCGIGLLFMVWALVAGSNGGRRVAREPTAYDAMGMCEQFLKERLKSPSTADFSARREGAQTKLADGAWHVTGHVDAQNGFGAMIRTKYDCTVRHAGGDRWTLVALETVP